MNSLQARQTIWINKYANSLWEDYRKLYPKLLAYTCPRIIINNRLSKTAGYNSQAINTINLSGKFLAKFEANMLKVILPHELAHQIDFNLFGYATDKKCGHGKNWASIMIAIGQEPIKYHNMVL